VEPTQLQPGRGSGHQNASQRSHVLIRDLDQPAGRLGADPAQLPAVSPMEKPLG
jgi:hypothetical protein